jgi:cyclase
MNRKGAPAVIVLAILLGGAAAVIAQNFDKVEVKSEKLADNIWMLKGAGGNIGICAGDEGVVMIDDQYAPLSSRIKDAVKAISDKPIRTVINTHWHPDHTGGNENFSNDGAEIFAQENVRRRMSEAHIFTGTRSDTIPPSPQRAWPVVTFIDGMTLYRNGEEISVIHVAPAHTDGDAFVWFHHANVIHTGDLCFNGMYPRIDGVTGGNIDGMIAADDRILALADDRTRIIPGHGPSTDKAGLKRFRDMLVQARGLVAKEIKSGHSLDQTLASHATADLDSTWGKGFMKPPAFYGGIFQDLASRKTAGK